MKKKRATENRWLVCAGVETLVRYDSDTYPLGSGGNQGYLAESLTTFAKPALREAGMTVRASQERLQPCTVGFLALWVSF